MLQQREAPCLPHTRAKLCWLRIPLLEADRTDSTTEKEE